MKIYPSFSYHKRTGKKYSKITGEIDICDANSNYLDSFDIEIWIDTVRYPYTIPVVKELSAKIHRDQNWHIDEEGHCCLDIEHELEYKARKGIELVSFYQECIYPFFANTLYKKFFGKYANGEYDHFFNGIVQFYNEKFHLRD